MKRPKNYKKTTQKITDKILDFIYDYIQFPYYKARHKIRTKKESFLDWYYFDHKKAGVYYYYSSTDCDLCTREGYDRVRTKKSYLRMRKEMFENAEGSTSVHTVDKEEYFMYFVEGGQMTDYIMQAFENGDGHKVTITKNYFF